MFDVFYSGVKPNLFVHEQAARDLEHARQLSRTRYFWWINYLSDYTGFDFLFEPVPWESQYTHTWPSQHHEFSGTYLVPTHVQQIEYKFHTKIIPNQSRPDRFHNIISGVQFDWAWHPHPHDPPYQYVFGNQWWPANRMPTVEYHVPGATERKYIFDPCARLPERHTNHWHTLHDCEWDYSWVPDPGDPPLIYVFGNQWWPANRMPTVEYHVSGATKRKYMSHPRAQLIPDQDKWTIPDGVDTDSFDFTWHPDPGDPPYIYQFGTQHQRTGGPRYVMPDADTIKYVSGPRVAKISIYQAWTIPDGVDTDTFDFTWHPDDTDDPYIYQFGTQHQSTGGPRYVMPDADTIKYVSRPRVAKISVDQDKWTIPDGVDIDSFDFTWHPDDTDDPYIYQFGTQHQRTGGPVYTVPGAVEIKYVDQIRCQRVQIDPNWSVSDGVDIDTFDFTWHPDATDEPYIYQFGTQHQRTGGPRYHVSGASKIKYINALQAQRVLIDDCWSVPDGMDVSTFDFTWHPDADDPPYIYQFGTQHQSTDGPQYRMAGATTVKYITASRAVKTAVQADLWWVPDDIDHNSFDFTWHPNSTETAYIYQFGTQWQRTGGPQYRMPGATQIKYISHPRAVRIGRDTCWTVPAGADVSTFDFTWHPDDTDDPYIYQFGTQHQRTGGPRYTVPGATAVKYVDQIRITTHSTATAIYEIDHLDGHAGQIENTTKTVRYFDNYLDTLLRLARNIQHQHEFVWICSSICDYRDFDFSWHPEQWQASMLHVFASDDQKFGDTFFMHVPSFVDRAQNCQLLEWYDVNFVDRSVPRRAMPVIVHDLDSHVPAVKTQDWLGPLALFTVADTPDRIPVVPLWRSETKTIVPLSAGAGAVVVPRVAKASIRTQLYDYKHIDRSQRGVCQDHPLDIVFIDNGEPNAEENWKYLGDCHMFTNQRIERSSGVNGRVAAYHAAARLSATPWFFAVFAKLRVNKNFDWSWQPDRMQMPKHYIFQAFNPTNGLTYGHQAMIAYNKQLVLDNPGVGLDFTLDSAHEVVPILSGTAEYAHTPWMAWRTAFREALKLKGSDDVESQYRLNRWCANGTGVNAHWSSLGAQDAVEYYEEVGGDFAELKKSYDWAWLASYALLKRNLTQYQ